MAIRSAVEPIATIISVLEHLSTRTVHETYAPFLRLPVLHAVRVSMVWASLTRSSGRDGRKVGVLQDLFGYLVMAWGGSTLASLLQSTPPPWLISPTVCIVYPLTYLVFVRTNNSSLLNSVIGIDLLGAYADGLTRGSTIAALNINPSKTTSTTGRALLAAIATGGGGWIVHTLGLHRTEWTLSTPPPLAPGAGILGTLDVWAAVLSSLVHSAILSDVPLSSITFGFKFDDHLGQDELKSDPKYARAMCVLIMGSLLVARVITKWVLPGRTAPPTVAKQAIAPPTTPFRQAVVDGDVGLQKEKGQMLDGEKSGTSTPKKRKGTPKKSPAVGK